MISLKLIPWYVKVLAVLAICLGCYFVGRRDGDMRADLEIAKYEVLKKDSAEAIRKASENVKEKIVTQYVDRIKKVTEKEYVYITLTNTVPDTFEFSNGWVHVHDASATGGDATSTGSADGSSSGIGANEGLQTIIRNYGKCHKNAEQIRSLQLTIREFEKIIEEHNLKQRR